MYFEALILGIYTFIASIYIDPCTMKCPSLSLEIFFVLTSVLPDVSIATPAFLWLLNLWYIFFHPFTFNLIVSLNPNYISICFLSLVNFFMVLKCLSLTTLSSFMLFLVGERILQCLHAATSGKPSFLFYKKKKTKIASLKKVK